jgi:hypothetical protein
MKKLILILFVCASFCSNAQSAYQRKTIEDRAQKFTKEISDYVATLSDSQKIKLFAINRTVTMQFDSLKNLKLESNDYKPAARMIFKNRDAAIKNIFSAIQFDDFMMQQAEKREESYKRKKEKMAADSLKNSK